MAGGTPGGVPSLVGGSANRWGRLWLVCFAGVLALCAGEAVRLEVCLRELTIHVGREEGSPSMSGLHFACGDSGRNNTKLGEVENAEQAYRWDEHELPITYVNDGGCRECALKVAGRSDANDTLGAIHVCARDFEAPRGLRNYSLEGQFDTTLQCEECMLVVAAADPRPLVDASNASASGGEEGSDYGEAARTAPLQVVDILSGLNHSVGGGAGSSEWSATNGTKAESRHASLRQGEVVTEQDATVWVASSHSRSSESSTSAPASSDVSKRSSDDRDSDNALIPIVAALSFVSLAVGGVAGALLYRSHVARCRRRREEEMHELEDILGERAVDLERVAVQDVLAMRRSSGAMGDWRPRMWNRLPSEPEEEGLNLGSQF